jgi:hypothetical protein
MKEIQMDVYFLDNSPETIMYFNKATQLIQAGQNTEGLSIIQDLFNKQKVNIVDPNQQSQIPI